MRFASAGIICAVVMVVAAGTGLSWAYEEISVTDGGAITGRVTMVGGKPTPKGFNLITFPDPVYCGLISTGT
jgi:hypothetical protein